jgi:hypothetical protein
MADILSHVIGSLPFAYEESVPGFGYPLYELVLPTPWELFHSSTLVGFALQSFSPLR